MSIKTICAGIGAITLIGSLAACGSAAPSGGSGGNTVPQTMASWYNMIGLPEINLVNQDIETVGNDQKYGVDPMSDEEQLVTDAQAGLVNLPPIDARDWTGWLNDVILCFQADEEGGYPSVEVLGAVKQYSQDFAAAVADATGSGSPSAAPTLATDPNGDTCSSLDANGYCYADDPAVSTVAPAPRVTDPAGSTCSSLDSAGYCPDDPAAPAPAVTQTPPAPAAGFVACGTGADGEEVYAEVSTTSCPFALNVEQAYVQGGYWNQAGTSQFNAYSPVTGSTYLMTSSSVGNPVVVTGGNNALVEFSVP